MTVESAASLPPRVGDADLVRLLALYRELVASPELNERLEAVLSPSDNVRPLCRARDVSFSMPEELTAAVQRRVGRGAFSQYVTQAVAKQLEMDLLAELSAILETEHGPVSEQALAEAGAGWPDAQ
ncbi:hypothetical protein Lfu02_49150 [Longispora fulva]|uniref:Arc/MetJ-type ribon-helix-helix transcriptional regulator n=1 Tax=Longispora fulva TaxID=619741 RepID=A0A8J7GK42_9ACTN|nr:hypothetical protein [Longispora fulva]MBG6138292.1 Arc/MetJ-type ribon-helix-helix transcriptional regulator [Longispora fulva]GIG60543.1 hypothetical protein Lfu02_49150 [Longispora fulva]